MKIELTSSPVSEDEEFVRAQTIAHAEEFMPNDVQKLCAFIRDEDGKIVAGLTGKTFWNYLAVDFLWVEKDLRGKGHGSSLLASAENEAKARGCSFVQLDTFSFQALEFYERLGYKKFGNLGNYTNDHVRYYLYKNLIMPLAKHDELNYD